MSKYLKYRLDGPCFSRSHHHRLAPGVAPPPVVGPETGPETGSVVIDVEVLKVPGGRAVLQKVPPPPVGPTAPGQLVGHNVEPLPQAPARQCTGQPLMRR